MNMVHFTMGNSKHAWRNNEESGNSWWTSYGTTIDLV